MVSDKFSQLRSEYDDIALEETSTSLDPLDLFAQWFDAAASRVELANAMTLATVGADGQPSARTVLLKHYDERGFAFYTNYASQKGAQLAANPRAALCFFWLLPIKRQVRIEGRVAKVGDAESDAYFRERPRDANLSALASPQSQIVASRAALEELVALVDTRWRGRELERPSFWGGYRLVPEVFEFWQGRANRLHDRLRYRRQDCRWIRERLAP